MRKTKAQSEALRNRGYELYMNSSITFSEIAVLIGVGKDTVSDWAARYRWKETKAANSITREKNIANMLVQINNLNENVAGRDQKWMTPQEADMVAKITKSIREMSSRTALPELYNALTEFMKFLHSVDANAAKLIADYSREFLQSKTRELEK